MKQTVAQNNGKIWLKKETQTYRGSILFLTFLSVFATFFSILFAYVVRYLVNSASNKEEKMLWIFSALLLSLLLLKIILKVIENFLAEKLRAKITVSLKTKIFSKLLHSDYATLQAYHSGELLTRLTTDIQDVASYSVSLPPVLAGMIIQCVGAVIALFTINPLFTCIYIVAGSIFAGLAALFRKQLKLKHKDVLENDEKLRSYMQESFSSLLTIKSYAVEHKAEQKAAGLGEQYYQSRMKRNTLRASMNGLFSLLSNFGLIFAVVWCSISVLNGNTDYGAILSSILLLMQLQSPLSSFSSIPPAYYARITSGERLAEIDALESENNIQQACVADLYNEMTAIQLNNIDFSYGREPIFDGASFQIKKGEIICLTGASGAGKSTIFKLLLNIYTPTKGQISIVGASEENQRLLTTQDRVLFAYVPQGNFLFSGTIYENLSFFAAETDPNIMRDKMAAALQTACAEFVFDLPDGLKTVLTENGGGLSEGQLQRLAIARALLSERPILLFDESTSALDGATEKTLIENISNLKDKTCLIVTHRPAALAIADTVISVENGKILTI